MAAADWKDGNLVDLEATLTQVGSIDSKVQGKNCRANFRFQALLRPEEADKGLKAETEMSCYLGRLSVAEAVARISLGQRDFASPVDAVRYAKAGELVKMGFKVVHSPNVIVEHVSVTWDTGLWDDAVARLFDRCFLEFVRG